MPINPLTRRTYCCMLAPGRTEAGGGNGSSCEYRSLRTLRYLLSGRANTYSACPVVGTLISGASVDGTSRGLPPPSPVVTATYCLPSTENVIGKPCTDVARRVCQRIRPVRASTALKLRSRSPTKTTPPAVEITDVRNGARCCSDHTSFRLLTS